MHSNRDSWDSYDIVRVRGDNTPTKSDHMIGSHDDKGDDDYNDGYVEPIQKGPVKYISELPKTNPISSDYMYGEEHISTKSERSHDEYDEDYNDGYIEPIQKEPVRYSSDFPKTNETPSDGMYGSERTHIEPHWKGNESDPDYDDGYIEPIRREQVKYTKDIPKPKSSCSDKVYLEIDDWVRPGRRYRESDHVVQKERHCVDDFKPPEKQEDMKGSVKTAQWRRRRRGVVVVAMVTAAVLLSAVLILLILFVALDTKDSKDDRSGENKANTCRMIIITDEWNPAFTHTLIASLAHLYNNSSSQAAHTRLGLITQNLISPVQNPPFNITLRTPELFLETLDEYTEQFCCARVSDLILEALDMFNAEEQALEEQTNILIYVSLYDEYFRESLDNIQTTAEMAHADSLLDRVVSVGYDYYPSMTDRTEHKALAVSPSPGHIYSFTLAARTQRAVAESMYENSLC